MGRAEGDVSAGDGLYVGYSGPQIWLRGEEAIAELCPYPSIPNHNDRTAPLVHKCQGDVRFDVLI
jgi:hypothetical protein